RPQFVGQKSFLRLRNFLFGNMLVEVWASVGQTHFLRLLRLKRFNGLIVFLNYFCILEPVSANKTVERLCY
ncbi:MAG: hypothetical protein K2F77_02435, partial [Muribaculaceae bacterium]|nr:hypothetical protein [Muribaculaceae bacterium]